MSTDDFNFLTFNVIVWGSAGIIIFLLYWYNKPISYKNFKPKIKDLEKDLQIFRDVYGHKKEDETPEEEPVKKSLWDRILEAIGL